MQGRSKLLTAVAMVAALYWSFPVAAQDSQKDVGPKTATVARAEIAAPKASAPAAPSAMASEEEVTELKSEMRQLRTLVEEQQTLIAKLKGGSPSSTEASSASAPSTPAPALPSAAPQPVQEENPEQAIRPFKIGGFGTWSYGKSNNVNEYDLATYSIPLTMCPRASTVEPRSQTSSTGVSEARAAPLPPGSGKWITTFLAAGC